MSMPSLLLQRPPGKLQAKELSKHLECHFTLWRNGNITALLEEGRVIQAHLPISSNSREPDKLSRQFTKYMLVGNINAALSLISDFKCGRSLSLDEMIDGRSVKDLLLEKNILLLSPWIHLLWLLPPLPSFTLYCLIPSLLSWSNCKQSRQMVLQSPLLWMLQHGKDLALLSVCFIRSLFCPFFTC